jgi:hypothetical protein
MGGAGAWAWQSGAWALPNICFHLTPQRRRLSRRVSHGRCGAGEAGRWAGGRLTSAPRAVQHGHCQMGAAGGQWGHAAG